MGRSIQSDDVVFTLAVRLRDSNGSRDGVECVARSRCNRGWLGDRQSGKSFDVLEVEAQKSLDDGCSVGGVPIEVWSAMSNAPCHRSPKLP